MSLGGSKDEVVDMLDDVFGNDEGVLDLSDLEDSQNDEVDAAAEEFVKDESDELSADEDKADLVDALIDEMDDVILPPPPPPRNPATLPPPIPPRAPVLPAAPKEPVLPVAPKAPARRIFQVTLGSLPAPAPEAPVVAPKAAPKTVAQARAEALAAAKEKAVLAAKARQEKAAEAAKARQEALAAAREKAAQVAKEKQEAAAAKAKEAAKAKLATQAKALDLKAEKIKFDIATIDLILNDEPTAAQVKTLTAQRAAFERQLAQVNSQLEKLQPQAETLFGDELRERVEALVEAAHQEFTANMEAQLTKQFQPLLVQGYALKKQSDKLKAEDKEPTPAQRKQQEALVGKLKPVVYKFEALLGKDEAEAKAGALFEDFVQKMEEKEAKAAEAAQAKKEAIAAARAKAAARRPAAKK